ncbi:MAG: purine-binding chemotaxis protein CheW [Deltaproteobacteria bacterium]|nr:purine-binding chemotaxis protein CheW [Deltaproteobacteria bacterium]
MQWDHGNSRSGVQGSGIFAIRGNLDGETEEEFTEKEQFIGLKIGDEEFYLPIAAVNEIVMLIPITYVPQSGKMIEGVINLRGTILPAINLRKMMGLKKGTVTPATRIIIVRHNDMLIGLIVDTITYVHSIYPSEIETQTLPGKGMGSDLVTRISKNGSNITGILDISKIFSHASESAKSGHDYENMGHLAG